MVDFPEYYEQMQGSLRAPPSAPATTVRPVTGRDAIERYDAARLLDEATQFRPPPARPPVNRAPAPSVNETRNQPAPQSFAPPQPQQPSVLDMLRQRMQSQIDDESNQRLREIGIGMLRSRSPNFFSALGEGLEAADTGSRSRMDRLRQIADAERQQQELETRQAAQRAEEEYRRRSLELREREIALQGRPSYIVVGQDASGNAIVMDPRNPTQRQTLEGVTPMQVANLNTRSEAANRQLAARLAEAAVNRDVAARASAFQPALSETERTTLRRQREAEILESLGLAPLTGTGPAASTTGGGGGGAGGPAARIDALGNPVR
jgi:hypothetical protein